MQTSFIKLFIATFFPLLAVCASGFAQPSLTGPLCVSAGTEYQYDINIDPSKTTSLQLCISGGVIAGTDSTCRSGALFNFIRVIWDSTEVGSISVNSSDGNTSINVEKTTELNGGKIDTVSTFQSTKPDDIPSPINCSAASGGSCSPVYLYQWQQSFDGMKWFDIDGAVLQNLSFSSVISKNTYYRRKVKESVSGSENFSDVAVLIIETIEPARP